MVDKELFIILIYFDVCVCMCVCVCVSFPERKTITTVYAQLFITNQHKTKPSTHTY